MSEGLHEIEEKNKVKFRVMVTIKIYSWHREEVMCYGIDTQISEKHRVGHPREDRFLSMRYVQGVLNLGILSLSSTLLTINNASTLKILCSFLLPRGLIQLNIFKAKINRFL